MRSRGGTWRRPSWSLPAPSERYRRRPRGRSLHRHSRSPPRCGSRGVPAYIVARPRQSSLQEQLDDRHLDGRPLHGQLQGQRALRDATYGRVLGLLLRVYDPHLYLRGVVEELRVFHPLSQPFEMDMLEGPAEKVQVEPVTVLCVAAVGRRGQVARRAIPYGALVQPHPLPEAAWSFHGTRLELAAGVRPDV